MLTVKQENYNAKSPSVVCLGNFDGLHIGHRMLIKRGIEKAKALGLCCAVLSFDVHPAVFLKNKSPELLISREEKEKALEDMGVDLFVLSDFSKIKDFSCEDFVQKILIETLRAKEVICGFNYSFGKKAMGSAKTLKELLRPHGAGIEIVPEIEYCGGKVSSTVIRELLKKGDCRLAAKLLGGGFCIDSPVTEGKKLGRTLGFPTANQELHPHRLKPKKGVYLSTVTFEGKSYPAISNLGERPTVENDGRYNCESFIIGFSGDLYGKKIQTRLWDFIREEKKFSSKEELTQQIEKDLREVEKRFDKENLSDASSFGMYCDRNGIC